MDRRVFLAVILTAIVIVVTPLIFPGTRAPIASDSVGIDTVHTQIHSPRPTAESVQLERPTPTQTQRATNKPQAPPPTPSATAVADSILSDTNVVSSKHMAVWYADRFGAPLRVQLDNYQSRTPNTKPGAVQLRQPTRAPLLSYDLMFGDSVLSLANAGLNVMVPPKNSSARSIAFAGTLGTRNVLVTYLSPTTEADRYLLRVTVGVTGAPVGARLLIHLPKTLASAETDTTDDIRHLAFGYKPKDRSVQSIAFSKLDSGQTKPIAGSLEWVAVRNKYFLIAIVSPDSILDGASFTGGKRIGKLAIDASGETTVPIVNGTATFDLYAGPQEYERLHALGHDLDRVNPYAGWFHAVVQPFATVVIRVLLWMKGTSGLSYGWVIIIFGIAVRVLLWPLYQSSMRTSIRMQRLQPELTEVQKKYKNDPEKQRDALVKLYQAHGMTPFSPMMGCLPMLLPMPILFALYFVFLNTIEFRGVPFLWMHDISAADPYYITPLVMGISMFALSWISMRGTPPTAQTRMMSYMMPVVFTFMFLRFAAGLNLYYAVQNIAALPQQWLLARERASMTTSGTGNKGSAKRDKT
jgi:YidC/Oxa1 family membrane protein insertase